MGYAVTLTSNNQITVPKNIRELLGVKSGEKIVFNTRRRDVVTVERQKTVEEVAREIQAIFPKEVRENFKKTSRLTAGEFRERWPKSDEARAYYDEQLRRTAENE